MPLRYWLRVTAALFAPVLLLSPLFGQDGPAASAYKTPERIVEPAVPADPLELVTGEAQPVQDVSQRAQVIKLLVNARRNSNVRAYPYDLKTRFTAFGSSTSDGTWQLEDTSPGRDIYRWTAQGPSYSAVNIYSDRVLYSNQPAISVPLRLAQVRAAIFFLQPMLGPYAVLRTATASLNGSEVVCALVSHGMMAKGATGGRRWEEEEYCVEPKTGNLMTYSTVPGLYVLFDYSKALQFHDKIIANKFTITQAGHTIIEAQTESVGDAQDSPAAFQTTGLNTIGVGPMMTAPWRIHSMRQAGAGNGMIVLHGMQAPNGHLADIELIASTNSSLNSAAVEFAAGAQGMRSEDAQGGTTPQSHEVILTVQYAPLQNGGATAK